MKEIKSCLIEYTSGNIIAINLKMVFTIFSSKQIEFETIIVSFGVDDYYAFDKNKVTESSWYLLNAMMCKL